MRAPWRALALASMLVLGACQSGGGADVPDDETPGGRTESPDPGAGGDPGEHDLVLRVHSAGGFVPWGYDFRSVPSLTVYGDGRAVTVGPTTLQYPGPALPNLLEVRMAADDVAAIVGAAGDAGLLAPAPDYGMSNVTDLPTTTVTIAVGGETFEHAAYGLGMGAPFAGVDPDDVDAGETDATEAPGGAPTWDDGLTDEQRAARDALAGFVRRANELVSAAGGEEPYDPHGFAYLALPAGDVDREPRPDTGVVPWPLDAALAEAGECAVVVGDDAATLRRTLAEADELTQLEQDGVAYQVFVRPLLPHESGCADLT